MRIALISLPALSLATLISVPSLAGTLSCRSLNGNINCSGSGAVSCQTVNGRTVCTNGSGDVVQSFGSRHLPSSPSAGDIPDEAPDNDGLTGTKKDDMSWTAPQISVQRTDPSGSKLSVERRGDMLRLRTDRLSIAIHRDPDPDGVTEP